ncbi:hypothetical protein AAZX31_04G066800 [Glycine max]|uniref:Uncharacterized protein n=2 Tax=Glycine subgen. Soja TaxID=1462606 RepID=I1JUE4_SOYBN|nr:putative UPF0481 protein At3g02645 [Glycine max]XP_028228026.1 putative UPF0481 protein At3g02645 [Glycine soja]KAG5034235.1 hypothetical protein JHK87_009145 [Glycine soja]KAG5065547.1 hypothetical protein JHK86_009278 [Glycine max]KAH1110163.1 hypothetical protein GYH30_009172 [Glycine max]KHN08120.1 UPF0481 protein [Glycine soja]KRH61790.1 hypothetical protein GLYMA_04G068200v4 [Glycine max]|eukprot:XP_003523693.1 putative UPF0481 protein At3g02645 [Glycine max]
MRNQDDVVNSIRAMLEKAEAPVTDECCIYRVPFDIRKLNEDAYTPKVVSIGPFHHKGNPRLQNMEKHKLIYCNAFLKRSNTGLETWIRYIQDVEPRFRSCYSDALEFTKEELLKIILVDSGFIFELFWLTYYEENSGNNGSILLKPWLTTNVRLDLLLLENQLPFFVLDHLFGLSMQSYTSTSGRGGKKNIPPFIAFTFDYFSFYNRSELNFHGVMIKHFTDLLRTFHLQHPQQNRIEKTVVHLPSAAELSEAGVRFKANTTSKCCLLDLKFSGGVLEIPQLKVQDWTELIFRNMVALEQCHYPYHSFVTDYVAVLDFLVNTSRDVDVLVRKGVLVNWLGDSDSVADMFNGLWKNVTHINFSSHYSELCQKLNAFCRNPCHKLKSTLRRDYCKTPWQIAVSIAGIVLLVLSLVQSVCSVLQVIQQ